MPILAPEKRKVQGEWGGSAHSPDPTAQSARRARDLVRARTRSVGGRRWPVGGGALVGCGVRESGVMYACLCW